MAVARSGFPAFGTKYVGRSGSGGKREIIPVPQFTLFTKPNWTKIILAETHLSRTTWSLPYWIAPRSSAGPITPITQLQLPDVCEIFLTPLNTDIHPEDGN
jgi:hypothetical protein